MILVYAWPILTTPYFVTLDGPAHVYNAQLINRLLGDEAELTATYFAFNPEPVPNWGGHVLLIALSWFTSPEGAEKVLQLIYLVGLCLAFRSLVKQINPEAPWAAYLVFPLLYSFPFLLGFYNFCLAMVLLFFLLSRWMKWQGNWTLLKLIGWGIGLILLVFTHLLTFTFFLAILGILLLGEVLENRNKYLNLRYSMQHLGGFILATIPALFLGAYFFLSTSSGQDWGYKKASDLWTILNDAYPMVTLATSEAEYSQYFPMILMGLLLFLIIRQGFFLQEKKPLFSIWVVVALVLLALVFILPDNTGSGWFISIRIAWLCFFGFALWLASFSWPRIWGSLLILPALALGFGFSNYHKEHAQSRSDAVKQFVEARKVLEPNSSLVALNYSGNWLESNYNNYLGAENNVVVLENYEADKTIFPLIWKPEADPKEQLGNYHTSNTPWIDLQPYESQTGQAINYIVRWKYRDEINDSTTQVVNSLLVSQFEEIHSSENQQLKVYRRRKE